MNKCLSIKQLLGGKRVKRVILCEKYIAAWFLTTISIFSVDGLKKIPSIDIRNSVEFISMKDNESGRFPVAQYQPNELGWMFALNFIKNFGGNLIEEYGCSEDVQNQQLT